MCQNIWSRFSSIAWTVFVLSVTMGMMLFLIAQVVPTAAQADVESLPLVNEEIVESYPSPVAFDPSAQAGFGQAAQIVTHYAYLENNTLNDDSFSLSLEPGNSWSATIVPTQTAVLTAGARLPITVTVAIPPGTTAGDMDSLTIMAQPDSMPWYTGMALMDTAVICEPHLTFSGYTAGQAPLDHIYEFGGQKFAYLLVNLTDFQSYYNTFATITGYNPLTNEWDLIAEQIYGQGGVVVHQTLYPPTYSKIRVQASYDFYTNLLGYEYQFAICREPVVGLEPAAQNGYVQAGETAVYQQTLTNWAMGSAVFDLSASGNAWPVSFWHNGSEITRTALLEDLETFQFEARVATPPGTTPGDADTVFLQATAVATPTITASAAITTYITGDLAYVTLSSSDLVAVVDTANKVVINTIDLAASGCDFPWRAAIAPDGGDVYVSCYYSSNVVVIDTTAQTVSHVISPIPGADDITFSRNGQYAFIGSRNASQIVTVDTATFFQMVIPTTGYTRSLAPHPFLDLVYATSNTGEILILNATTFNVISSIDVVGEPWDVVVSPDGQWLYAGDRWGQGLSVVDLATNSLSTTVTDLGNLTGLDLSPDGSTLYAGMLSAGVRVIDTATFNSFTVYVDGNAWETAVTCDGSQLYVGSTQNFVPIVDTTAFSMQNLPMPGSGARGIAICPQFVADGVILFPQAQRKQGVPDSALTYSTTLRNETGQTDSFSLAVAGTSWPTELSHTLLGPLNQGAEATFVVTVTIPAGANWYDLDVAEVTATSVTSPTVYSGTVALTTEAYAPPQITVFPDSLSSTQLVNSQVTQTLAIANGQGVTLTYDLAIAYGSPTPARQLVSPVPPPAPWPPADNLPLGPLPAPETAVSPTALVTILTDPLGDGGPADAIAVLAASTGADVTLQIDFAPAVIPQNVVGYVLLDIDQNPATGADPATWVGLPTQDVGVEYYISLFNAPSSFSVYSSDGMMTGMVTPVYDTNSVRFTIPLDMLGDDEGGMHVAIVLGDWSWATEWVPDAGHGVIEPNMMFSWLTVDPDSGAVFTGSSADIAVLYNSDSLQPGSYPATIRVQNNDPANSPLTVPVEMVVEPTATMGWVEGYVTDSRFGTPVQATIVAQGQPYTITAGLDGYYKLWLEAGSYDLAISAPGYLAQQHPITITAQQGFNLDVALVEDVPVFSITPDSITVTQYVGDVTEEAMTLGNSGPAEMTFSIEERDTTSGLALLASFARSEAERAALLAAKQAGDEHNEGAPTIATIPAYAFTSLQGSTNILAWTRYTDYYEEYTNSLNAIAQYTTFNLTETDTENPVVLAALLAAADVLLFPEQEYTDGGYLFNLGQIWGTALQSFVNNGGTIVLLDHCNQGYQLLQGAGLVNMQLNFCSSYYNLEVVNNEHPLVEGVPPNFLGQNGIAFYAAHDGETILQMQSSLDSTVVMAKDVGAGHLAVIGFDFYIYNDEMARILANAVQWYSVDVPWLTTTPVTGTVPGYAGLDVAVSLDAAGLQPGLYSANLIVTTNDPYTPTLELPVSMEVLPTITMGQVVGSVSDSWTGNPLTATVQLQGVYTMTATPTFSIWAEAGDHTLTAFTPGFMTETVTVSILAGGTVTQNLALVPAQPRLEGVPENVVATAVAGHSTQHSFTLSDTGPLPLEYTWHEISPTNRFLSAPNDLAGKSILLDLSHGGAGSSAFSILIQDIVNAGGTVAENYTYPITAAILTPYDVLWVNCCGYEDWTPAELTVISAWLQQGGALFLHGSGTPNTQLLAELFGIEYVCCSYSSGNTTNILPHPTTVGINTIYIDWSDFYLSYSSAADLLLLSPYDNYALAVAQEENGGRIVVMSAYTFYDWSINNADNRTFALNIMDWLAAPVYTDVPWVQTEPVSGTIPAYDDQLFTMTFDATTLAPGTYEMTLVLEHNDPAQNPIIQIPVTLEVVAQQAAVSVTAEPLTQTAVPGESAAYEIVITNTGNGPDSFAIAASGDWAATLSAANTGLLGAGESFTVTVSVAVPAAVQDDDSDVTAVTVTSAFNPSVSQTLSLTTTAVIPTRWLYLPVVIRP